MKDVWTRVTQTAGPLVKECRYRRPRLSPADLPSVRREKNEIMALLRNSSFRRTPADRLELMLALFGYTGRVYCLTFDDEHLPPDFKSVRRVWRNFLNSMRRHRKKEFDYVYVIEGKHGDHRYHIHLVLRDEDFTLREVRYLWPGGYVEDTPLLLSLWDNYRRTAEYFVKERTDGIVLPIGARTWVASRSLYAKLPKPRKEIVRTGNIPIPCGCKKIDGKSAYNIFGEYEYAVFMNVY